MAKCIFKLMGWQAVGVLPPGIKKCVIIAAPHTSNWDFFYGMLFIWIMRIPAKIAIKKEVMVFPLGCILSKLGVVPIDRGSVGKRAKMVDMMVNVLQGGERSMMVIMPEGTRSYVAKWRTGFYHVAMKAQVPILFAFIDYQKKQVGLGPVFQPTGNLEEDFKKIQIFYKDKVGKYPAKAMQYA